MGLLLDLLLGGSNNKGNSLEIGDWVRIKSYGDEGEIIAIHGNLYEVENATLVHHINQALRANYLMKKDVNYVIECFKKAASKYLEKESGMDLEDLSDAFLSLSIAQ